MRSHVTINFGGGRVLELEREVEASSPQAPQQAHQWLDETYEAYDCEPVRMSGKVLLQDRILAIALALGYEKLRDDTALADGFVRNTVLAIGRPRITVDVQGLTIVY